MTVFDMLYLARRIEELEARIRVLETRQSPETYMQPVRVLPEVIWSHPSLRSQSITPVV